MGLLDLPPELFSSVISFYVDMDGVDRAWRKRGVCKAFATYIEDEILENQPLQAFKKGRKSTRVSAILHADVNHCTDYNPERMPNLGRFLFSKIMRKSEEHTVFTILKRWVDSIASTKLKLNDKTWSSIAKELCNKLAICGRSGKILVDLGSSSSKSSPARQLQDKLAVAVLMNDEEAITVCFSHGATFLRHGQFFRFGSPLFVTAVDDPGNATLSSLLQHINIPEMKAQQARYKQKNTTKTQQGRYKYKNDKLWDYMRLFNETIEEWSLLQKHEELIYILNWYNRNFPNGSKQCFNHILLQAITSRDPRPVKTALRCKVGRFQKITWEHFLATLQGDNVDALRLLIKYGGFDINRQLKGTYPLHTAAKGGCVSIVHELLEQGADPNGPSYQSAGSPLEGVVLGTAFGHSRHEAIMDLLVSYGATLLPEDLSCYTSALILPERLWHGFNNIQLYKGFLEKRKREEAAQHTKKRAAK